MAAASWEREDSWTKKVQEVLTIVQTALKETRESANSDESFMSMVVEEAPRLETRVQRLHDEYQDLEQRVGSLLSQL